MAYIDTEIPDEDIPEGDENENIRNLRRKAKDHDKLQKENDELRDAKRELEFVRAGIDTTSPMGTMFLKAYDGEISAEAIKTAWEAVSGTVAPTETEDDSSIADAARERQNLAAGASGDTGEAPEVPVRGKDGRAVRAGLEALAHGAAREDALGVAFGELAGAAAAGDRSVIVPFGGLEQP